MNKEAFSGEKPVCLLSEDNKAIGTSERCKYLSCMVLANTATIDSEPVVLRQGIEGFNHCAAVYENDVQQVDLRLPESKLN